MCKLTTEGRTGDSDEGRGDALKTAAHEHQSEVLRAGEHWTDMEQDRRKRCRVPKERKRMNKKQGKGEKGLEI